MKNKNPFLFLIRAIVGLMPKHIKRMFLWTMLYSKVRKASGENTPVTEKQAGNFNDAMNLCNEPKAMKVPLRLGEVLWPDTPKSNEIVKKFTLPDEYGPEIPMVDFLDTVPDYLKYSTGALMEKDLAKMKDTNFGDL
jgi:hypothetical protein